MDPTIPPSDAALFAAIDRRLTALERSQRQTPTGATAISGSAVGVPVPSPTLPIDVLTHEVPKSGRVLLLVTVSASWVDGEFSLRPRITDAANTTRDTPYHLCPHWSGFANPFTPAPRTLVEAVSGLTPGIATVTFTITGNEWDTGTVNIDAVTAALIDL